MQNELYSNVQEDYRIEKETCEQHHSENLLSDESEVYSNVTEDYDSDKERYKQQENELYTEFEEDYMNDKGTFKDQESENLLYESAGPDVEPNPIYDWPPGRSLSSCWQSDALEQNTNYNVDTWCAINYSAVR